MDIKVTITRTRHNTPLVVLDGGCFNGTELTPEQLIMLCATLSGTADAAAEENVTSRHWKPRTFTMRDVLAHGLHGQPEPNFLRVGA